VEWRGCARQVRGSVLLLAPNKVGGHMSARQPGQSAYRWVHERVEDGRREDERGLAALAVVVGGQRELEAEDPPRVDALADEDDPEELADVAAVREEVHTPRRVAHQMLEFCVQ
jgi:hypothetical protein